MKFRNDIQGLRALAVLSVMLFHIDASWLPAGFLGVDIFFVISGYLITGIILRQKTAGTFSFAEFYIRRLRRLLPASVVTILITLLVAFFIFTSSDFSEAGRTGLHALLFTSNIVFWLDAGYFDDEAYIKPFLHFWSLSVEEQFYMLWPAIVVGAYAVWRRPATLVVMFVLTALSLAGAELVFEYDAAGTFFLMPFRVFEFGIGAIIGIYGLKLPHKLLQDAAFLVGLVLMVGSMVLLDGGSRMPGLLSLPACIGCALCLLSPEAYSGLVLRNPVTTSIGNASYSIYLAHWPPVVFWKYAVSEEMTLPGQALVLAVGLALGYAMYFAIETPFRKEQFWAGPKAGAGRVIIGSAAAVGVMYVSASAWATAGWHAKEPVASIAVTNAPNVQTHVAAPVLITDKEVLREAANGQRDRLIELPLDASLPTFYFIGDSHAKGMLNTVHAIGTFNLRHDWIQNWCQPVVGERPRGLEKDNKTATAKQIGICKDQVFNSMNNGLAADADVIVLHSRWAPWSLDNLEDTIKALHEVSDAELICINDGPMFESPVPRLAEKSDAGAAIEPMTPGDIKERQDFNREFAAIVEANDCALIDKYALLCDEDDTCPVASAQLNAVYYYDSHHLTLVGADYVANKILTQCDDPGCEVLKRYAAGGK